MNVVDLLVVAALAFAVYDGYRSGFVRTIYGLVTWIVGLVAAVALSGAIASLIERTGLNAPASHAMAFVGILLVAEALFALAGRYTLTPLLRAVRADRRMATADRVVGVVPSVARAVVIAAVVLSALVLFPVPAGVRDAIDGSRLGSALVAEVSALQPDLERLVGAGDQNDLVVTKLSEDQQQRLSLPDDLAAAPDPAAEQQMVDLVNRERASRGLPPLAIDPRLVPVARAHAAEMFRLKYFGHVSPVTGTTFDRLSHAGITSYQRAGENLAYAQSVDAAHRGLMDSEAHRENILRPEFTRIGIGVVSAGIYGRMFVQLFLTP